jgi:hypothetical protein
MPFCSALFLKTAIKAAEIFEHLIILSRGLAPSGPLSFCQSFPCVFLQAAEISVFSKVRVCAVERSKFLTFLSLHNEPEPRPSLPGWSGSGCCVAIFYCQIQHRTLKIKRPSAWDTRR